MPLVTSSDVAFKLLHEKLKYGPKGAVKRLVLLKYLAFKILAQKLYGLVTNLYSYLPNMAKLKHVKSLNPIPPIFYSKHSEF